MNGAGGHARRLMKRMEEKGIKPNHITWNTLLRCVLKEVKDERNQSASEKKSERSRRDNIQNGKSSIC